MHFTPFVILIRESLLPWGDVERLSPGVRQQLGKGGKRTPVNIVQRPDPAQGFEEDKFSDL